MLVTRAKHLEAGLAAGVALTDRCRRARRGGCVGSSSPRPYGLGIQSMRRQEAEVVAADDVAQGHAGARARRRCDPHPDVVARLDQAVDQRRRRAPRAAAATTRFAQAVAGSAGVSVSVAIRRHSMRTTTDDDRLAIDASLTIGLVPSPRQRAPMSSFLIRCCSRTMPSSSASGRGGQPGRRRRRG